MMLSAPFFALSAPVGLTLTFIGPERTIPVYITTGDSRLSLLFILSCCVTF